MNTLKILFNCSKKKKRAVQMFKAPVYSNYLFGEDEEDRILTSF